MSSFATDQIHSPAPKEARYTEAMKYFVLLVMCLSCVLPLSPADAAPTHHEIITVQQSPDLLLKEDDYWRNAGSALAGSATGNGLILLGVILLDVVPAFTGITGTGEQNLINSSLYGLALFPALITPLMMFWLSPDAEWDLINVVATTAISILAVAAHLAAFIAFSSLMPANSSLEAFYLAAPVGLISAILFEALVTAQGYHIVHNLRVLPTRNQGAQITYHIDF